MRQVRFKSYALSHVKSPLRKELEIWLDAYPKRIKLGTIVRTVPEVMQVNFICMIP